MHTDNSLYLTGNFINLSSDLHAYQGINPHKDITDLIAQFRFIQQDIWNIGTLFARLQWMHDLYQKREINSGMWSGFASLDIDHFHIETKSIMDYSANIIQLASNEPKTVPKGSLRRLYKWMKKSSSNQEILGEMAVALLEKCSWFPEYSKIRDANIHNGGYTIVFSTDEGGIHFQNYLKVSNQIFAKEFMYSENLVDFQKYAAVAFSRVLCILEDLSEVVRLKHNPTRIGIGDTRMRGHGFGTYLNWSKALLSTL